ncbi:MAG TPA: alanine racemase [bacterium]|nr:alanine racemase [bacterium]
MGLVDKYFVRNGKFWIDGLGLEGLLAKQPTPCYAYSAGVIRQKYEALKQHLPGFDVFYSFKANPNLAIAKMMLSLGAGADVSSLGEIKAAYKVGYKPENMVLVGPAKTEEELRYAMGNGVAAVIAESPYEVSLIDRLAARLNKSARVMLRINTLEQPAAPEIMVGGPSKFGIDEELVVEAIRALELKHAKLVGIHTYAASQVLDAGIIGQHLTYVADLALKLAREIGFELQCVDFGGGFGVPYADEAELDLTKVAAAAAEARARVLGAHPGCRLVFEVGRYLVAESGIFLTRVTRIKSSRGRTFIMTDAGMNHFSRPVLMRVNHPVRLLNRIAEPPAGVFDIGGPICTPLDTSGTAVPLPAPELGDVVGFFVAGAYGYSMSMVNFMSLGWPAEVLVDAGKASLVRKPHPAEDCFEDQPLR